MMHYIQGDLLETPTKIIAHGCNARGVMGSGVARLIKERFPTNYEFYRTKCLAEPPYSLMGSVVKFSSMGTNNQVKTILNCITQVDYGSAYIRHVSYDAVDKCFRYIAENLEEWNKPNSINKDIHLQMGHLAIPKIGAGLGGGNWLTIESIIDHHLKDFIVLCYHLD